MGRIITAEEAKSRTGYDLAREAVQMHQPLIVTLEDGTVVSIQQYQPSVEVVEELPALKPLLTLSGSVPFGWKDAIYGQE